MAVSSLHVLGAIGAVGTIGGGIYLIYPASNSFKPTQSKSSIRDRLIKEKYFIMESSDNNWATVFVKYNEVQTLSKKKFTDLISATTELTLKQKCKNVLSSDDFSVYEMAKIWCTVPKTIQQRLQDLEITILKTTGDDEDSGDKSKWISLEDQYRNSGNDGIKSFTFSEDKDDNSWKKLRDECKGHLDKEKWNEDYEYYLEKVSQWCVAK